MADAELVMMGVEELQAGKFSLKKMVKLALSFERYAAQIQALSSCIRDGTLYTQCEIKNHRDFAFLHFVLKSFEKVGKEIQASAKNAVEGDEEKKGQNGHGFRFAEFLQESSMTSFKSEGLGTFYIYAKKEALPPSKKDVEKYAQYEVWAKTRPEIMMVPGISWSKLQALCLKELEPNQVPSFITIKERSEVRMRKA